MLRLCCTDLVAATARGHQKLSLFLLEEGADPNTADGNGITALHYLVLKGFAVLAAEPAQHTAKLLLELGSGPTVVPELPAKYRTLSQ